MKKLCSRLGLHFDYVFTGLQGPYAGEWYCSIAPFKIVRTGHGNYYVLRTTHQSTRYFLYNTTNFNDARWWVTVNYLHYTLNYPQTNRELESFLNAAETDGWPPLRALADWLEERGDPRAVVLRDYLPSERKKR